jgi:alkane 1-monooxygenase
VNIKYNFANDLKYLLAYTIPVSALIGIQLGGYWCYTTVFYAFGFIPIWEAFLSPNPNKLNDQKIERRLANRFFDLMLYFNLVLVFPILGYGIWYLTTTPLEISEIIGLVLSFGIVLGTNGINVAHELGHRKTAWERLLAKILLMPALYMHFYLEHNFGHHLNVGTPKDPATSKKNQSVFSFWFTSTTGQIRNAISIQKDLLKKKKVNFFSIYNDFFYYQLFQLSYLILIAVVFGVYGVLLALGIALTAVLLLETINYIEHYGLIRKEKGTRYERVTPMHSWNSNHALGRLVLYELTRHSDHHHRASKKYQILESIDESPELPFGYTTSMLIALVPPVWFKLMNKRIPKEFHP